jgi:hypothetical protein
MMAISTLYFALQQISIYFGLTIFIAGIIGGLLNIIIFTTARSFRQNICTFFLTVISIVNVGQLLTTPLVLILAEGFNIDLRKNSWFCKCHMFLAQWRIFVSLSSSCLATINQFLSMGRYQRWRTLQCARCSIFIAATFGFLHSIFVLIYFAAVNGSCTIINSTYAKYVSRFQYPIFYGCLSAIILITFSVFTFIKARTSARRTTCVRRFSQNRQLTTMVLVHAVYQVLTALPYICFYIYSLKQNSIDPEEIARDKLIEIVTTLLAFSVFSVSTAV